MKRILNIGGICMNKILKEQKLNHYWKIVYHALDKMEEHKYDLDDYYKWREVYVENMNYIEILNNMK